MNRSRSVRRGARIAAAAVLAVVVTVPTSSAAQAESPPAAPPGQRAAACPPDSSPHNLIVGSRAPGDRLVATESVVVDAVPGKIVTAERTLSAALYQRITLLHALDQVCDGTGAYASDLLGGPGFSFVTLKFKSQRGEGINFSVEVYAR
ncbi:MBF2 family protein [Streptomyces tsukubensis]|uniref:MBF2 family protein n=1 Tax=Streptomyces tsukubensis TaxID=83656 RepID=UPI00344DE875